MNSAGGASCGGIISLPVGGKCWSRILRGWQHNDTVSEATRSEVNVEMATFRHVVPLCVVGARFAAALQLSSISGKNLCGYLKKDAQWLYAIQHWVQLLY